MTVGKRYEASNKKAPFCLNKFQKAKYISSYDYTFIYSLLKCEIVEYMHLYTDF